MKYTIYHNSRCRKSRAGLDYLLSHTTDVEVIEYLKSGLDTKDLETIVMKLNVSAVDLVRTQEEEYKNSLRGRSFTEEEWIKIICNNPKLLRRPIVVNRYKAVIADPPDLMDVLFKE
jgi:arsenate reductase (glutaredoxin)